MQSTSEEARRELLRAARERLHISHELDLTGRIAADNACVGIGKILYALQHLRIGGEVRFTASLDFTITRNADRWESGFSYGGALELLPAHDVVAIPEIRPNTCGTIVGVLRDEIAAPELMRRVCATRRSRDGSFDYSRKNHFINLYTSSDSGRTVFIIHGCPAGVKFDTDEGPGLYLETSPHWKARVIPVDTPLGRIQPLIGDDAVAYWTNYRRCEARAKADRLSVARTIFGEFDLLADHTHEGMFAQHVYLHGCHGAKSDSTFPVMSSIGEPAFIVTRNHDSPVIGGDTAILPHGTGYSLQVPASSVEMEYLTDIDRVFVGQGVQHQEAYAAFDDVPFVYRGSNLVARWEAERLLTIRDVLQPQLFLKL